MAIPGAKPKPPGQAVTRHKPVHEWVEVVDVPFEGGPKLPTRYAIIAPEDGAPTSVRIEWPKATRAWWRVISRMPHCVLWTESDWQFAIETAEAHARFIEGRTNGTELRIRQKQLGTTMDSRRDLRIRYVKPRAEAERRKTEPAGEAVVNLDDYR